MTIHPSSGTDLGHVSKQRILFVEHVVECIRGHARHSILVQTGLLSWILKTYPLKIPTFQGCKVTPNKGHLSRHAYGEGGKVRVPGASFDSGHALAGVEKRHLAEDGAFCQRGNVLAATVKDVDFALRALLRDHPHPQPSHEERTRFRKYISSPFSSISMTNYKARDVSVQ